MGGCITILHLLWSCLYRRMNANTFICGGVVNMGGCMIILLSAVELCIWEDAWQYFYLLWSCLYGRMHANTFICCGVD